AKAAKKEISAKKAILLVNERADIALAAGADGVHLPSRAVKTTVLRRIVPPDLIIGISTHSADEVLRARDEGADFTVFGPVFESPGKGEPVGLEELTAVCAAAEGFPILALGGVNEKNCTDVLDAGARGVAAIRALNESTTRRQILEKIGYRVAGSVKDS
ncbi:MAG: thiamine phosphate synthase, partial [Acidobacteriota bacterium]